MKLEDLQTIEQLSAFLEGTQAVAFSLAGVKESAYRWIQGLVRSLSVLGVGESGQGAVTASCRKSAAIPVRRLCGY